MLYHNLKLQRQIDLLNKKMGYNQGARERGKSIYLNAICGTDYVKFIKLCMTLTYKNRKVKKKMNKTRIRRS